MNVVQTCIRASGPADSIQAWLDFHLLDGATIKEDQTRCFPHGGIRVCYAAQYGPVKVLRSADKGVVWVTCPSHLHSLLCLHGSTRSPYDASVPGVAALTFRVMWCVEGNAGAFEQVNGTAQTSDRAWYDRYSDKVAWFDALCHVVYDLGHHTLDTFDDMEARFQRWQTEDATLQHPTRAAPAGDSEVDEDGEDGEDEAKSDASAT